MASIFGIEYQTPEEIKAARNQRWEDMKAQVADNPNALAAISGQQAVSNLFPSKAETQAAEVSKRLRKVMAENQQLDGEDDFDYQVRIAKQIRDSVADVNPEMAIQANDNMLKTARAKQEMAKLKMSNEAERLALDEEIYEARQKKRKVIFGNRNGQNIPLKAFPPGTPDEVVMAALDGYRQQYKDQFQGFDIGNGLDIDVLDSVNKGGTGSSDYTANKALSLIQPVTDAKNYFRANTSLLRDLTSENYALADYASQAGGELKVWEVGFNAAKDAVTKWLTGEKGYSDEAAKREVEVADSRARSRIEEAISERDFGTSANVVRGKVLALAYQLAKTFDPGGRLSDQDVNMALTALTGRGGPEELYALLTERGDIVESGIEFNVDEIMANEGDSFSKAAQKEVERYVAARAEMQQQLEAFYDAFKAERAEVDRIASGEAAAQEAERAAKLRAIQERAKRNRNSGN